MVSFIFVPLHSELKNEQEQVGINLGFSPNSIVWGHLCISLPSFLVRPGDRTSLETLLLSCCLVRVVVVLLPSFCRLFAVIDSESTLGTIGNGFCENCKKNGEILLLSKKSRNFAADLEKINLIILRRYERNS